MSLSALSESRANVTETSTLRIGLFGHGVVGSGITRILEDGRRSFSRKFGVRLEVAGVCVRDPARHSSGSPLRFTNNPDDILTDDSIDVVIEVMGGQFEALDIITRALRSRKHVITANKLLLSYELPELTSKAERCGVHLLYSASVCGSIPALKALDDHRASDRIERIRGIVNGSTNFILTCMSDDGRSYEDAMAEARVAGFLEADPTLDISGADAAQKLSILAYHAFGRRLELHDIRREGIESVSAQTIREAAARGNAVKLIADAAVIDGTLRASVSPQEIPLSHLFAHTKNEFNALEITCRNAGVQLLYGKGAGSLPTASAVIGDLVTLVGQSSN